MTDPTFNASERPDETEAREASTAGGPDADAGAADAGAGSQAFEAPERSADEAHDGDAGGAGAADAERGEAAPDTDAAGEASEPGEPPAADEASEDETPEEAAPDPVAAAQAERDEYLELLRRERAEFENFRKRASKEHNEAVDRGVEQVCSELMLVLDNFGYTLQAAEQSSDDQLAKGVEMVHRQIMETLGRFGLETVPGEGATFDPTIHEAVAQVDADEELGEAVEEPVVVEVMRPGYRFKDRLLRPASVKVAK